MDQNNTINGNGESAKLGRPPKQNGIQNSEIRVQVLNQPQFWYQSKEATEIIIILAKQGQILFKCLSGEKKNSEKQKTKKFTNTRRSKSLSVYRKSRQAFVKKIEQLQSKLLKKLEEYLKIELIGKKKEMNYFFFQDNKETNLAQEPQNIMMKILRPYIHKDFQNTLITLLELKDPFEGNLSQLANIDNHKHFVSWAFIKAWGCEIRLHIKKLQKIRNNQDLTEAPLLAEELNENSEKIKTKKEKEVQQDIGELIKLYENEYKEEIVIIMKQFKGRIQENKSEDNSFQEVN